MRHLLYTGALLVALLGAMAMHWAAGNFARSPASPAGDGDPRLTFTGAAHLARQAAAAYEALPSYERRALRHDVQAALSGIDAWARHRADPAGFICLGERHDADVRAFIASRVLPLLDYDALLVEAGEDGLEAMEAAYETGRPVSLLEAPFGAVMAASGASGVPPRRIAVDETAAEREQRSRGRTSRPSREDVLVTKTRRGFVPGEQHVALLGALHCRDLRGWFFNRVAAEDSRIAGAGMLSTVVLARYQETGAQLLFYLLERMDIRRDVLAVPDVALFPREVLSWLPPLADAFAGYDSALLFDERAR